MIFEGNGKLLIIPKILGETSEIHTKKAITILDNSDEIKDTASLNKVVAKSSRETFEKVLNLTYN